MRDAVVNDRDALLSKALAGQRVVVTRSGDAGDVMLARLRALGAVALHCPSISISPPETYADVDRAIESLEEFAWVLFTSANSVIAFLDRLECLRGMSASVAARFGAIGTATARALESRGLRASFISTGGIGAAFATEIDIAVGTRVLIPSADIGLHDLARGLVLRGAEVTVVVAYRTIANSQTANAAALLRNGIDAISFTSPSTLEHFVEGVRQGGGDAVAMITELGACVACIGSTTAAAARSCGFKTVVVASSPSNEALIDAIGAELTRRTKTCHPEPSLSS